MNRKFHRYQKSLKPVPPSKIGEVYEVGDILNPLFYECVGKITVSKKASSEVMGILKGYDIKGELRVLA